MARRGIQRDTRRVARWVVLLVTCFLLLAGCVMPDGTVYTLPTVTPDTSSGEKSVISDRFDVDISVNADGTFDVTEHIGIRFIGGDFSTGFRDIPKQNLDHIDGWGLVDCQGTVYELATGGDAPYTFVVEDTDEAYDIVWKFPPIADASEIFSLSYTVHDGLRSYEGGDELWWQAIYGDRSFPVLEGTVRVAVPANSSIREWSAFVNDADASARARAKASGEREVVFDLTEPLEGGEEFGVRVAFTSDIAGAGVSEQQSVAAFADEPSPAQPFIDEGDAALDAGDFEAALEAYGQAIEADPSAHYAYYGRALTYDILGDVEAALEDLAYSAALAPVDAQIAFLRAEILHYMGDAQGMATVFDELLAATNDGADLDALDQLRAYYFRSQARTALGDLTGAAGDLGQALRLNPLFSELYGEYRRLAGNAELMDEKVAEYARLAEESDSPDAADFAEGMQQLLLAQLTQSPDAYGPAVESLTAAIDADPELAPAYHARGIARIGAAALQSLLGNVAVGPDYATYTDPETAEEVTISREEWDADWELQEQLAQAAREEAIKDLAHAVELEPDNAEFVHDLGVAHFSHPEGFVGTVYSIPDAAGREQALALFDQAVELDPEWDQARLSRAIASAYWGFENAAEVATIANASVDDLAFSEDGSRLIALRTDRKLDIWDLSTGTLLETLAGPQRADSDMDFRSLALNLDGTSIVTTDYGEDVKVWDVETGELVMTMPAHESGQLQAIFSPDGSHIAAAGWEMVNVWDAETGEPLLEVAGAAPVALSPDGTSLIASAVTEGDPDLSIWDLESAELSGVLSGPAEGNEMRNNLGYSPEVLAYGPEGRTLVALSEEGDLHWWNLEQSDEAQLVSQGTDLTGEDFNFAPWDSSSIAFSPDGQTLVVTRGDGRLTVYDVATAEELLVLGEVAEPARGEVVVVYDPGGERIVSAGPGTDVHIRDASTGDLVSRLERGLLTEEAAQERLAFELLQRSIDDATVLIDREAGAGWPYLVRVFSTVGLATLTGAEMDESQEALLDADSEAFERLSPDIRVDDVIGLMPGQVCFSSPGAPAGPLMAGRIERTDDGRSFIHEAEGFRLQLPAQGGTGRVVDIYVPGGPALVSILDDFRDYRLVVMDGELGDMSPEKWLAEMLMEPGSVEAVGTLETELGEAFLVSQPDYGLVAAILPVDGRIFYLSYAPGWLGGLELEEAIEVVTEFVEGLSLAEE